MPPAEPFAFAALGPMGGGAGKAFRSTPLLAQRLTDREIADVFRGI